MIGNINKETFPPKTDMQKNQVLQDPGYVGTVEACLYDIARSYKPSWCLMVHMSTLSIQLDYNVDSNIKYSNYMKIWLKALNYFELQQTLK